jgi:hypothetical protein
MKPKRTPYAAPSLSRLVDELGITTEQAETIRGLIRGEIRTKDTERFPASNTWFDSCLHEPKRVDRILACINETMEGFGVEAIYSSENDFWPAADYINTGDAYSTTILFSRETSAFQITSWGDFFEKNERRYKLR